MKRLLIISVLILVLTFLISASCGQEEETKIYVATVNVANSRAFTEHEILVTVDGNTKPVISPQSWIITWTGQDVYTVFLYATCFWYGTSCSMYFNVQDGDIKNIILDPETMS